MDNSEEQFQELIAQITARSNKTLKEESTLLAFGLALNTSNEVDLILAVEVQGGLGEELNFIQVALKERASNGILKACAITYPDYENGNLVSYLENFENYCLKVEIPVIEKGYLQADVSNIETHDGSIYVFSEYVGS